MTSKLGGKRIKEGDKVVMWFASRNRDEDVFGNPYDFDATRRDNDHVAFGEDSPHPCLGNPLARTGIRIMSEELHPRRPSGPSVERTGTGAQPARFLAACSRISGVIRSDSGHFRAFRGVWMCWEKRGEHA